MSEFFDKTFSSWINVTSEFRNDWGFADRNKAYGSYQLLKNYNKF